MKVLNPLPYGAESLRDQGFVYFAEDSCGGEVDVKVDVWANELEAFHDPKMALLYKNGNDYDAADLYVSEAFCQPQTNDAGQCLQDPDRLLINPLPQNLHRSYTVEVTATDLSGNEAVAECKVVIIQHNTIIEQYDLDVSKQRFHLQHYRNTFPADACGGNGCNAPPAAPVRVQCTGCFFGTHGDCQQANTVCHETNGGPCPTGTTPCLSSP